jgi:protoporphyrinogen oxidase
MTKVVVIGTGMAAFGAAHRLAGEPVDVVLYDKNSFFGGQTTSFRHPQGFTFDKGPHVSFTKDERIQQLFADNVDGKYETVQYQLDNYWRGHRLPHPVQTNMYGLPVDVISGVITDFVKQSATTTDIRNYEDWLVTAYGRSFAEQFPFLYTQKYHTTAPANLTTDWVGPRMYRPSLDEMLRGALAPSTRNVHYITGFRYPTRGGFMSYVEKWARSTTMKLSHKVVHIDSGKRTVTFANGQTEAYDALISSVALPDLMPLIAGVPEDVLAATHRLACSGCVLISIGVNRPDTTNAHISYYYDTDIIFSRTSSPHLMSPNNVPPGCGSIQAEVYFSAKYKPLLGQPDDYIEPVIRDLKRCGMLREEDKLLFQDAVLCEYANIIFDHDRTEALRTVHGFLDDVAIRYCGRYGDWGYMWTDESFKSGEAAATRALDTLRLSPRGATRS